jgi:hypothetical protein
MKKIRLFFVALRLRAIKFCVNLCKQTEIRKRFVAEKGILRKQSESAREIEFDVVLTKGEAFGGFEGDLLGELGEEFLRNQ